MAFKTDERYKISKCYDHELLQAKETKPNIFILKSYNNIFLKEVLESKLLVF